PALIGVAVTIALFAGIMGCLAIGGALARRAIARYGFSGAAGSNSLETAVFAFLGLLIAFTFSGALTRFDVRRGQVVAEANAIGTAYYRVDLLPASVQPKLRASLREYVDSRIETYRNFGDLPQLR